MINNRTFISVKGDIVRSPERLPDIKGRGRKKLWKYHGIYAKIVLVHSMHGGKGKRHRDALCLCRWKGR